MHSFRVHATVRVLFLTSRLPKSQSVNSHRPWHQSSLHDLYWCGLLHSRSLSFSISRAIYWKFLRKYAPCSCRAIFAARSFALTAPKTISISSRERPFVSGIMLPNCKCHAHYKQSGWKYSENGAIAPTFSDANIKNIL
jgi:hypothetical protein